MGHFIAPDHIPYRYGLDALPADITKRELLCYFSFNGEEKNFIIEKSRIPSYRIVIGIQLGAFRFIGKPQIPPENTPPVIIRFVAETLDLGDGFVSLEYSDREKTRREHAQITREFLGLSHFPAENHHLLIEYLTQQSPDPGNIPNWMKNAEDFLREKGFVLLSVNSLRRLIMSARHQSMERVMLHINSQIDNERKNHLDMMLESQGSKPVFWSFVIDKSIYSATPKKVSEVLKRIKGIRQVALKDMDLTPIPYNHVRHLARQGFNLSLRQLRELTPLRRYATMAATLRELETELTDVAIQMNDEILAAVFQRGQKRSEKYFRKYRRLIRRIISAFRLMSGTMLKKALLPHEVIEYITQKLPLEKIQALHQETDLLYVPRGSERLYFASQGYSTIQKYLPELLETFKIVSSSKKDTVLEAADYYFNPN